MTIDRWQNANNQIATNDIQVLAEFQRNERKMRVTIREYNGSRFLSMSLWFQSENGEWNQHKHGLTVRARELAEFRRAIDCACVQLIPEEIEPGSVEGTIPGSSTCDTPAASLGGD